MDVKDLEKLGLNRNEAKVYFGLLRLGQATAADLVKLVGVHRNIVYDNLEKLIDKGVVSCILDGAKRKFIAEPPESIVSFLEGKEENVRKKIGVARGLLPEIRNMLSNSYQKQDASLFRGASGIRKILLDVLKSKEFWVIGVSNASVNALGETFWGNYNLNVRSKKIKEHLLINYDFENIVGIKDSRLREHRVLPKELTQVTEVILFDKKVAMTVYSDEPIGILIEDSNVFSMFRSQFDFLWNVSSLN